MGQFGWTLPLNSKVYPDECISLLQAATSPESADNAFVEFYSKDNRVRFKDLIADLQQQPQMTEFLGLLEEVAFALEAQKYRLAVPALIAAFEGVVRRCWDNGAWKKKARDEFFALKLQSLKKESYAYVCWISTKAFIDALYIKNEDKDPKPQILNRHWVLHGRGPADGNLADGLRLLQAIHTVVSLANKAPPTA